MPSATTARTRTRERAPYRKSRSMRLDSGTLGPSLVRRLPGASLDRREHVPERPHELRELEGQDELRGRARAERLQRIEVLEHERLLVDALRGPEDRRERVRVPLGIQDRGLFLPLGPQDRGLLVALRDGDG